MAKNREVVKNYLRGLADSVRLMMADRASTLAVMAQVLKIDDADSLEYSLIKPCEPIPGPIFFPPKKPSSTCCSTMSYEDPAFATIPPFKFFDLSLIQELKARITLTGNGSKGALMGWLYLLLITWIILGAAHSPGRTRARRLSFRQRAVPAGVRRPGKRFL